MLSSPCHCGRCEGGGSKTKLFWFCFLFFVKYFKVTVHGLSPKHHYKSERKREGHERRGERDNARLGDTKGILDAPIVADVVSAKQTEGKRIKQ